MGLSICEYVKTKTPFHHPSGSSSSLSFSLLVKTDKVNEVTFFCQTPCGKTRTPPNNPHVSKQQPKPEAKISFSSTVLASETDSVPKGLSWENKLQTLQTHWILWVGPSSWLQATVLGQCWGGEKLDELLELNLLLVYDVFGLPIMWVHVPHCCWNTF